MNDKKCSLWWCDRPFYAGGYCNAHWLANKRYGSPYGIDPQGQENIDDVLKMAKKVAQAVIESEGLLGDECQYCHLKDAMHKPDCAVSQSALILMRMQ